MIAGKVLSEAEVQTALEAEGFAKTKERTDTGCFWKHKESGKSIFVPDCDEAALYPNWLIADILEYIPKVQTYWGPPRK